MKSNFWIEILVDLILIGIGIYSIIVFGGSTTKDILFGGAFLFTGIIQGIRTFLRNKKRI